MAIDGIEPISTTRGGARIDKTEQGQRRDQLSLIPDVSTGLQKNRARVESTVEDISDESHSRGVLNNITSFCSCYLLSYAFRLLKQLAHVSCKQLVTPILDPGCARWAFLPEYLALAHVCRPQRWRRHAHAPA
jgi:hypothetical protein